MQPEAIKQRINTSIEDADVFTEGEGCNFEITVVSRAFEGLSPVKKQQLVYACLEQEIASGAIHAISIKAFTPEQWTARQAS